MTLHALMVSLGPSLKVGNGVLSELLKHRLQLFAKPPARSEQTRTGAGETVSDLIDFGSVSIEPPSLGPVATISLKEEQSVEITESGDGSRSKKPPRLNSKPSLSKMFSSSSRNVAQFSDVRSATPSLVDVEPPRVDLTLVQTSPLPTFGSIPSPPMVDPAPPSPQIPSSETTPASLAGSEKQRLEDFHYPSGTVQARTQALSSATPIADLFQRKTPPAPLRDRDSVGSSIATVKTSASVDGLRPASGNGFRRGNTHSVFFAGAVSGSGSSPTKNGDKRNSRSVPGTPADKRSSTTTSSGSVKEMIKDMEKRDS